MKHTKGPWKISKPDDVFDVVISGGYKNGKHRGVKVGDLICTLSSGTNETQVANAQLIAAAPEMLEALIAIYEHLCEEMDEAEALDHALDGHDGETCVLCAVGEAIEKATARIPDCVC